MASIIPPSRTAMCRRHGAYGQHLLAPRVQKPSADAVLVSDNLGNRTGMKGLADNPQLFLGAPSPAALSPSCNLHPIPGSALTRLVWALVHRRAVHRGAKDRQSRHLHRSRERWPWAFAYAGSSKHGGSTTTPNAHTRASTGSPQQSLQPATNKGTRRTDSAPERGHV